MTISHGYGRYTMGCRCQVCTTAKVAYTKRYRQRSRQLRDAARAQGVEYIAQGIKHGLSGYQAHSCRCPVCKLANADSSMRYRARKALAGGAR
jgi:hypothetical protein